MDLADRLLWSCRDEPDDDAARLVWADAVGGERGELVIVQCELARGGLSVQRARMLRAREAALLAAHGVAWSGLEGLARRCVFRRGFVEGAEITQVDDATLFALIGRAPLLHALAVDDEHQAHFGSLFAQPELADVRSLTLETRGREADDVIVRVLDSPHTAHLTGLAVLARVSDREATMLFDSTLLTRLERLWMPQFDMTADHLAVLGARARRLRELRLSWRSGPIAGALPAGLRELDVSLDHDETWSDLVASPAAATLECVRVHSSSCEDVARLADLPRLRALDLGDCQLGLMRNPPSHWNTNRAFANLRLPGLRELSHTRWSRGDEYEALIANFGPQLELLHLPSQFVELDNGPALASRVAGTLSTDPRVTWSKGGWLSELAPNEPWLQQTVIDLVLI
jgi:hypothetical protein